MCYIQSKSINGILETIVMILLLKQASKHGENDQPKSLKCVVETEETQNQKNILFNPVEVTTFRIQSHTRNCEWI